MMKKMLFLVAGLLLMSTSAMATVFDLSITGGANGFTYDLLGTVAATQNLDGTYTITSGSLFESGTALNDTTFSVLPLHPGETTSTAQNVGGGDNLLYQNILAPGVNPALPAPNYGIVLFNGLDYLAFTDGNGPNDYYVYDRTDNGWGWNPLVGGVVTATPAPVPEPGTMMLLGAGFLGLAVFGKRRKNA